MTTEDQRPIGCHRIRWIFALSYRQPGNGGGVLKLNPTAPDSGPAAEATHLIRKDARIINR